MSPSDETLRKQAAGAGWPAWLRPRWAFLAGILVCAGLLIAQRISPAEALIGLAAWLAAGLLFPSPNPSGTTVQDEPDIRRDDETLAAFAESLATPCMMVSARGALLLANKQARQDFPALRIGSALSLGVRHPAILKAIDDCRREKKPQSAMMQQSVPSERWMEVRVAPLEIARRPGEDVKHVRYLIMLFDMSAQKRLDAMRADFIAYASHEMRTPLASIIGFIETLQGPAARDVANREKFLGIMAKQAERLSKLVDDMLSLSRIESRQHVFPDQLVSLSRIVTEAAEALNQHAKHMGVSLDVEVPDDTAEIKGDRAEVYEVVENLIDNALKYGADGERVTVTLAQSDNRPGFGYRLEVRDYGPGIDPVHVPRLTERFYRVDADQSREKKGTGLGLAIVKHIVQRHRGEMSIKSWLGEGTSVEILWPN